MPRLCHTIRNNIMGLPFAYPQLLTPFSYTMLGKLLDG